MVIGIICGFCSGLTIVFSRMFNAKLTTKSNLYYSTLFNYIVGLLAAVIAVLITRSTLPSAIPNFSWTTFPMYLGGMIGIITVTSNSYLSKKLPAIVLTLLLFVAQLFTGILIDFIVAGDFSIGKVVGGIIILFGLWLSNKK